MEKLSDLSVIRNILSRHGFTLSHTLGQNFLINPSVCPKMAQMCGANEEVGVLEIGPGIGVLTQELCLRAKKVVSIEIDKRLIPLLQETMAEHNNLKIICADVMKLDLHALFAQEFAGLQVVLCANLPYYITSPIIMRLLEEKLPFESLTVMVQKEAAQRFCAAPGTRECGAVSVAVQYYAKPEILFPVSRGSFYPAPNVDSAVVQMRIRQTPPVQVEKKEYFFDVIKAAFGQRRKTIGNALAAGLHLSKTELLEELEKLHISPSLRAEQLQMENFAQIANFLWEREKEKI